MDIHRYAVVTFIIWTCHSKWQLSPHRSSSKEERSQGFWRRRQGLRSNSRVLWKRREESVRGISTSLFFMQMYESSQRQMEHSSVEPLCSAGCICRFLFVFNPVIYVELRWWCVQIPAMTLWFPDWGICSSWNQHWQQSAICHIKHNRTCDKKTLVCFSHELLCLPAVKIFLLVRS